ncbi:Hypothetical protein POVN_LOCUS503 [uncultured virus]|nr:Hypothetical protein POVN_LOCUS503 [uncultured virus]
MERLTHLPLPVETGGDFGLYTIYSRQPIDELKAFLCTFTDEPKHVGILRIDHTREEGGYMETNRTIALLHREVFQNLCLEGHDKHTKHDFRIAAYEIREGNHPPKDCGYALYMQLPLEVLTLAQCKEQLDAKMSQLTECAIITDADYTVHYPMTTRESKVATYRGYAIVTFTSTPRLDDCAMIKVILDQTKWWDKDGRPHLCRVSWCKKNALSQLRNTSNPRARSGFKLSAPQRKLPPPRNAPVPRSEGKTTPPVEAKTILKAKPTAQPKSTPRPKAPAPEKPVEVKPEAPVAEKAPAEKLEAPAEKPFTGKKAVPRPGSGKPKKA